MAGQADRLNGASLDRRIVALALPALGALAADPLLSLADTVFVSRLGRVPLGALGVDTALFSFAFFAFNFLAYATTPMVARRLGAGDRAGAGRVVAQALALALSLGAVSALILATASTPLVRLMQAPDQLVDPAVAYLRIRALAAPAVLVVTAGHGAFRGMQDTRTPLLITVVMNLANVILDPVLMFGFGMGLRGAAVATLVAQIGGAFWFVARLRRVGKEQGWAWHLPGVSELLPMLRTGGVLTLRTLFLVVTLTLATAVAASFGAAAVAAHQIVSQTWLLAAMIVDALAIAAQAMVADELGRSEPSRAASVAGRVAWWGLGAGVVLLVVLLAGRHLLASVFAPDPEVEALIVSAMAICALMQPIAAAAFVADGIYLGLLQVRWLAYSTGAGAVAGCGLLLAGRLAGWGLVGVWWAIAAMVLTRLAVLAGAYRTALSAA